MPCHGECSAICVSVVTQLLCPGIFESGKTKLKEEVWKANLEMEQMVLQHCPAGHEKVTSSTVSSFGVATVNKTFDHDSQQCRKCEDNEYIVNPDRDECTLLLTSNQYPQVSRSGRVALWWLLHVGHLCHPILTSASSSGLPKRRAV
eukprot:2487007-Rhodomonas_salina.2